MNLQLQMQFDRQNEESWKIFLGDHAFTHQSIHRVMSFNNFLYTVSYPFNEIGDLRVWLITHDEVHKDIAKSLGLSTPPDLSTVNFKDKKQFDDWMYDHQKIHDNIRVILGV